MDASEGLRAINEIDQLAQFEFSACHVSVGIRRVWEGVRPGMREFEAARLVQPIGLPFSCHPMLASGERAYLGLASPSDQVIERGRPFVVAIGVWGALSCRAGWMIADESELPSNAVDFAFVAGWYETIGIGVTGG